MTSATTDRRLGLAGTTSYKTPATVVATTNITQSGEQTIDGVAVVSVNAAGVPDRVLCTGMTDATKNGLWDVQTGAWTRSIDSNGNYDLVQGTQVLIAKGSAAFQIWVLTSANPITVGTSAITFSQILTPAFLATLAASGGSGLIGFIQSGAGAVATTVQTVLRDFYNIKRWGALVDGVTNDSAAIAATLVATGGIAYFPPGTCIGALSRRANNTVLVGAGSQLSILKNPAGALSVGGVVEIGDTASGNSATAYDGFVLVGLTVDGNRANATAPTDDLRGHGVIMTKITHWYMRDVKAINCWQGGITPVIDSNFFDCQAYVENCGNATYTGPGFDINSCKYGIFDVVSNGCYNGGRVLDNTRGINGRIAIFNPTSHGFIHQNQSVNSSFANNFDIAVYTCGGHGVILGENARSGSMRITVDTAGINGVVINDGSVPANRPSEWTLDISTSNCQGAGLLSYANNSSIRHRSRLDGRAGAAGTSYAADINGNLSTYDIGIFDSGTPQVRGVAVRAAATDNEILSLAQTGIVSSAAGGLDDSGARTLRPRYRGATQAIASAAALAIPQLGSFFSVTGTTNVTSATVDQAGRQITLQFTGALTFTNGGNLRLVSNFVTTANDTITLISDGANWNELSRSVL